MTRQALDWRDGRHWHGHARPCRYCGRPTPLADEAGAAAHKVCAEAGAAASVGLSRAAGAQAARAALAAARSSRYHR